MRELCVFSFPCLFFPHCGVNFELIKPPKNASRDVAHIIGNTPFGLENSGRIAAVSSVARPFKTKNKNGNSLRLKRRHVCIWHKVVPVKTVNHPCSQIAGQPPTWGGGWVRSTLLSIILCLGKARKLYGPEPKF